MKKNTTSVRSYPNSAGDVLHFGQSFESAESAWEQLIHLGSRMQSVEACPTHVHLEQGHRRELVNTNRLTGVGSVLPPICSEAWAKENAKDPQDTIFLLSDAAHGKHVDRKTNSVSEK
ncbi:hypothetical protein TNCV_2291941 [Trichonephila clavipes]|uniref:Uncharacterized protein n=1 Tax=Trichonephila clavipes TaxID=2585209 RepID=A0A8X6RRM8_TRICX|nr:hypothetical protein TNCV_2291941 [Trichonephila clavipes]